MELAGVFLRMVGPRPWNGPLMPLFERADLTAPDTVVNAAASHKRNLSAASLLMTPRHQPIRLVSCARSP